MNLSEIRTEIDQIDEQLTGLFVKRMHIAEAVAEYKRENKLPVYDAAREADIMARVSGLAGETYAGHARMVYSALFTASRARQSMLLSEKAPLMRRIEETLAKTPEEFPREATVACQGVAGAYSQIACARLFSSPSILYFRGFEGVFQAVESGLCQYGVLPIENSSYGSVGAVYDLMRDHNFQIVRSVKLQIDHYLLAKPGVKLKEVREIITHEQAIGQCGKFLAEHPDIRVTSAANTAAAAQAVAESGRRDLAAISSADCAKLYGLEALAERLQDQDSNFTRFICIAGTPAIYPGAGRISLMCTLPHRPGTLTEMMARFAALGLNLVKLESRPIPGSNFAFMFYFDLEASVHDPRVLTLLGALSLENDSFVFLGNYSEMPGGEDAKCAMG